MSEEEKKYTPMTYGLSFRVDKKMYDEWVAEMHKEPISWRRKFKMNWEEFLSYIVIALVCLFAGYQAGREKR